jgi:hypothetical protein
MNASHVASPEAFTTGNCSFKYQLTGGLLQFASRLGAQIHTMYLYDVTCQKVEYFK